MTDPVFITDATDAVMRLFGLDTAKMSAKARGNIRNAIAGAIMTERSNTWHKVM